MPLPRRFDAALMRPPEPQGAADPALLATLRAWCERGAFAKPPEPLRVACIAPQAGLDGVANALDGSHELARRGRWRGLLWRLQLLWNETVAGRAPGPGDPWDCGWWREGPLPAAEAFRPRRPTLLMLREPQPATARALLAALRAGSPGYARPLRVLVVSSAPMEGIERL